MRALFRRPLIVLLTPALLLLGPTAAGFAQTTLPGDPPARVGRLSHVEGQVSLRTPDQNDWSAAALNYPVSTGLALWTEPEGRAEISYGDGALRLDHETAVAVERLDDTAFDLRLDQGSVQLSVRHLGPRERVTIVTPQGRMEALQPGTYRIDAGTGDTPAGVTVLDGKARFSDDGRSVEAVGGESTIVKADGNLGTVAAIRRPFDNWALARESEVKAATVTPRYVPRSMPGHEDLERHGTWTETPEYGAVWYPAAVPVYWAPYRHGHWAWVPPWGWTWIDDAPWGFAPFHYGRWVHHHGRWGWLPGHYVRTRPCYAPALVAFVGGPHFSIGVSVGRTRAIGWVPLGPREVYYPTYRSSVTYVRNVNVVHVHRTVINNINVNHIKHGPPHRHADRFVNHRGATVVPQDVMRRAEPVHRAMPKREFDSADLRDGRPTTDLAALQPSRAARAGFRTDRDDDARRQDGGTERGPSRQASPGRPVTNDPDRLPPAPAPRRQAKATSEHIPQARPVFDGAAPDRATPERSGQDRRGSQGTTPAPSVQGRAAPQPEAGPRALPDRAAPQRVAEPDRRPPQGTAPIPSMQGREQGSRERDSRQQDEQHGRDRARPTPQQAAPAPGPQVREQAPQRREPPDRDGQSQRPQLREPAPPARSETTGRAPMPTLHGPGHDQGQPRTAPALRTDRPGAPAPTRPDRARPEPPTLQAPRPAHIQPPRTEQRIEQRRIEQPRMERRIEQPRVEQRAEPQRPAPQPPRQPERREPPRQPCPAGADCGR